MQIEIGFLIAVVSFLIGLFVFMGNRDKDVKKGAASDAVISEKLNQIGTGVDTIRLDMKVSDRRITELSEQLIRTDESAKSAHKRIDNIKGECK